MIKTGKTELRGTIIMPRPQAGAMGRIICMNKEGGCGIGPQLDQPLSLCSYTGSILVTGFPVLIWPMHPSLGRGFVSVKTEKL